MKALLQPVVDEDKRVAHLIATGKLKDPKDVAVAELNLKPNAAT